MSLPSAVSSGRQSTLATWLMTKNEGDQVRVRIGHVRGPNEFWIIPLPPISGPDGKKILFCEVILAFVQELVYSGTVIMNVLNIRPGGDFWRFKVYNFPKN